MIPIPKSKRGQKCSSDNYRAIALSSLIGKILDTVILKEQCESLMTDSLQFGFKEMSSTITCTSLLIETIEYYTSNNSNCYLLLLDASKAFDRLEYMRLFTILRQHNMCPLVIRLIMNMYINQNMQVRWNSSISISFHISNGVKQGGVISPVFFGLYIDNLIKILKNRNIGCKVGTNYMRVFGYTDDLSLLCPSLEGLKEMLFLCEQYAIDYKIMFNSKKSKFMCFQKKSDMTTDFNNCISMKDGSSIEYVKECVHLGNTIYSDISLKCIDGSVSDLFIRTNSLLHDFSNVDSNILSKLHNTYCMSIYGSQLWKFNCYSSVNKFYIAWRKTVRRIWKINSRTHNVLINKINRCAPIDALLEKRCIKFVWSLFNSKYALYRRIVKMSFPNMNSTIAENIKYFMYKYNFTYYDWFGPLHVIFFKIECYVINNASTDDICAATAIRELCNERDTCNMSDVHAHQTKQIIDRLCID